MATPMLHWILDPICGWSYGALPLINAVEAAFPDLQRLHFGGLYSEDHQPQMTATMRTQIIHYDEQIHQLTGVVFGDDYKNGLLKDHQLFMNSIPATHALLAVEQCLGHHASVSFLNMIQQGYYQQGLNITQYDVIAQLASKLGVSDEQWSKYLGAIDQQQIDESIDHARRLLSQVQGHGFPTLVFENQNGEINKIAVQHFYNKSQDFVSFVAQQLKH